MDIQRENEIKPNDQQEYLLQEINVNGPVPEGIQEVNDFFETLEKIREQHQIIQLNETGNDMEYDEHSTSEESDDSLENEQKEKKKPKKTKKDEKEKKTKKKGKEKEKEKKKEKQKEKDKKKEKERKDKKKSRKEKEEKKPKKQKKLTKDQIIKGIKSGEYVLIRADEYEKLMRTACKLQKRMTRVVPLDKK